MNNAAIVDIVRQQLAVGILPTAEQTEALLVMIDTLQANSRAASDYAGEAPHQARPDRFRAVFDGSALGLALIDAAGRISETNPALQQMLGYAEAELRGMSLRACIHAETLSADSLLIEELLAGRREHFQVEQRYLHKTGRELWVSQTVSLLREESSYLLLLIIEEISERKQSYEALRVSEWRYRTIVDLISDYAYVFQVEPDGRLSIEWMTDAFTRASGYTATEIDALGWKTLVHPDDRQIMQQHLAALTAGNLDEAEFRIVTKTGQVGWIANRGRPERDDRQGRIVRIIGAAADITERKRADARLQFLVHTSALLNASLDYEATLDQVAHLTVPFLSDACFVDILADDHSQRRMIIAHADPDKERLLCELHECYPLGAHWPRSIATVVESRRPTLLASISESSLQNISLDDSQFTALKQFNFQSAMIVPLMAHDQIFGTIIFVSEREQQHYTQNDLTLAEELGSLAAMAFDNARLYSKAQAAVEARDEFLSIAAHELKTPTAALLSATQLLHKWQAQQPEASQGVRRELEIISSTSRRLNKLIDTLTEFAHIQTGRFLLEYQPVVLCALARQVLNDLQPTPQHYVALLCADESLTIEGDALRLERVLYNLMQNAIKYSPRGGPVTMRVEQHDGQALIRVSDQGIGVPEAAQSQLFRRFYRANNAIQQHIGGMGIGLYLVKEIVARHGGHVEVRSMEGCGSTFTVRLPLIQQQRSSC